MFSINFSYSLLDNGEETKNNKLIYFKIVLNYQILLKTVSKILNKIPYESLIFDLSNAGLTNFNFAS
jgi:hypothetical protein